MMGKTPKLPDHNIQGLADLFHDHAGADPKLDRFPAGSTLVLSGPPGAGKTTFALGLVRSMMLQPVSPQAEASSNTKVQHVAYYISTEVNRDRLKRMYSSRGWFVEDQDPRDKLFADNPEPTRPSGLIVINPPHEIERPVKSSEELVNYIVRQISVQPPPEKDQFVFIMIDSITSLFKDCKSPGEARRQVHELVVRLRAQFEKTPKDGGEEKNVEPKSGKLGLILLLAEQGIENLHSPGIETYVADFVLQFGLKSLPMGARLRTLEMTKSQGANMMMGEHTWSILTQKSLSRLIVGDALRNAVYKNVARAEFGPNPTEEELNSLKEDRDWCSLVIAARPYFYPTRVKDHERRFKFKRDEPSGILGLDQMLRFDPDYWFGDPMDPQFAKLAEGHSSIRTGSVTMLVGAAGTGKTTLSCHLIAAHLATHVDGRALLVGFEQNLQPAFEKVASKFVDKTQDHQAEKIKGMTERCAVIHRSRSGLSFNLLLLEIREWLNTFRDNPKRVAIDGISNLAATHTRQEFSQMLDALISLFADHPRKDESQTSPEQASLFITYESDETDPMLNGDALSLPADNIVLLSHKIIEDDRRTAVMVIKSSHQSYDSMVRELVLDHDNPKLTHIHSGFDAYSGLLTGTLKRAQVVLQLFQENDRERSFNKGAYLHLKRLLPYDFVLRDFSRFEISSTLGERGEQVKVPSGDVQVVNMDEWWLSHKLLKLRHAAAAAREYKTALDERAMLVEQDAAHKGASEAETSPETLAWRGFRKLAADNHLTKLAGFVDVKEGSPISPGDFWCFEMEKVWHPDPEGNESKNIGPYALPSYLDFGMLCINVGIARGLAEEMDWNSVAWGDVDHVPWPDQTKCRERYAEALADNLLPWCVPEGEFWFQGPKSKEVDNQCLVDKMQQQATSRTIDSGGNAPADLPYGFAWDSRTPETAATFMYELAWAFGGDQALFAVSDESLAVTSEDVERNKKAVKRAFCFIGFLVHEGLMPACPTLTDTAQAVYSRQYYSTLMDINGRDKSSQEAEKQRPQPGEGKKIMPPPRLISLGFMPPGPETWQTAASLQADEKAREEKLQKRKAAARTDSDSPRLMSPNLSDISELTRWKEFRETIRESDSWGRLLGVQSDKSNNKPRTGYGCCGSWMIGIKSPTGAPGLAQVLLQEVASLGFAKRRARMGAGLPARQDFYRYYGNRPVTGMEYLSWNEMLKFFGSRGRRRDRIYPEDGAVDPAKMHRKIQFSLVEVMEKANDLRCKGMSDPVEIIELAGQLTEELFVDVEVTCCEAKLKALESQIELAKFRFDTWRMGNTGRTSPGFLNDGFFDSLNTALKHIGAMISFGQDKKVSVVLGNRKEMLRHSIAQRKEELQTLRTKIQGS